MVFRFLFYVLYIPNLIPIFTFAQSIPDLGGVRKGLFYELQQQLWLNAISVTTNDFLLDSNPEPAGYKSSALTAKPNIVYIKKNFI